MSPATLRFDPRLRIVWQHPTAVQIGIDPPRVVILELDDRVLALLHGLSSGMTPAGIAMLAKENSLDPLETQRFLDDLAPALQHREERERVPFVLDTSRGDGSPLVAVWEALGHEVHTASDVTKAPPGEVVIVADFVLDPDQHHHWLRLDRIHTPIVFTDQSILIGPRVVPGHTACLHCVREGALRANPYSVAIAAQLWGKRAPARTPALAALAAWQCYDLIHTGAQGEIRRIDALTREVTYIDSAIDPQCDCHGLG